MENLGIAQCNIPLLTCLAIFPLRNFHYIIIRVHFAFSLVVSCVLLKYTRTDDVTDGVI